METINISPAAGPATTVHDKPATPPADRHWKYRALLHRRSLWVIGARSFDVLFQFLTEAVMVCFVGGLAGIIFGYLPARKAAQLDPIEALARE